MLPPRSSNRSRSLDQLVDRCDLTIAAGTGLVIAILILQIGGVHGETAFLSVLIAALLLIAAGIRYWYRGVRFTWVDALVAAAGVYVVASFFFTRTASGKLAVWWAFAGVLTFATTRYHLRTSRAEQLFLGPIAIATALCMVQGLAQMMRDSRGLTRLFSPFTFEVSRMRLSPVHLGEISGTLGTPPAVVALCLLTFGPLVVAASVPRFNVALRWLCGIAAVFTLAIITLAGQPIALGVAVVIAIFLLGRLRRFFRIRIRLVLGAFALTAVIVSTVILFDSDFRSTFYDRYRQLPWSNAPLAEATWSMIQSAPLTGHGPGEFSRAFSGFRPEGFAARLEYAPTSLTGALVEWGLVGGFFLIGVLAIVLMQNALRTEPLSESERGQKVVMGHDHFYRLAILGGLVAWAVYACFHPAAALPATWLLVAAMAGFLARQVRARRFTLPPFVQAAQAALCGIFALVLPFALYSPSLAASEISNAEILLERFSRNFDQEKHERRFLREAYLLADQASKRMPGDPRPAEQKARALLALRYPLSSQTDQLARAAWDEAKKAIASDPGHFHGYLLLSYAAWTLGYPDEAQVALDLAHERAAGEPELWYLQAALANARNRPPQALEALAKLKRLRPQSERVAQLEKEILLAQ